MGMPTAFPEVTLENRHVSHHGDIVTRTPKSRHHPFEVIGSQKNDDSSGHFRMFPEKLLVNLIQLIYEAAADPTQWPVFLERLAESVGSPTLNFIAHNVKELDVTLCASVGFDPVWVRAYEEYYASRNVWVQRGWHLLRPGVVVGGPELISDQELIKTEFYNDYLRPKDLFYSYGGIASHEDSVMSYFTAIRSRQAGPFEEREFALLRHLLPHLQTAVRFHQRVAVLEIQLGSVAQTLNYLRHAVFIVDRKSRILIMNGEAEEILRAADGLVLANDGLRAMRAPETSRLRGLIAGAAETTNGNGTHHGGAMSVSRNNGHAPLRVLVSPSAPSNGQVKGRSSAIVFVTEPERTRTPDPALLEQLLNFTPAESRLAVALAAGKTVQEFAEEAGVSLNTVRTHLKRIFSKAGVSRQAELIRQLTALASWPEP